MSFLKKSAQVFVFALVFVSALLLMPLDAQAAETVLSGQCGDGVAFALDSDGILTVSGNGAMENYGIVFDDPPWLDNRESILNVVIEPGVTSIGDYAFRSCENILSFDIPDTVTRIGTGAFGFCEKITSISIPASVEYIGKYAFEWNPPLKDVYITDLDAWFDIEFADECANPLYWADNLYLNGKLVTEVTVPQDVTVLENCVLGMASLEKVVLHDGITQIGDYAFYCCTSLKEVSVPKNVTYIGANAFNQCFALEKINIPYGVTSIGDWAFSRCEKLKDIVIPDSVTYIGAQAFSFCDALTEITIPADVTKLDKNVFYKCESLETVILSDTLVSIGADAFAQCFKLKDVYYYGSQAKWEELKKNTGSGNTYFLDANIHIKDQPFVVLSDIPSMNIEIGDTITLSAGVRIDENTFGNASGISFQLAGGSVLDALDSGTEDGRFFVRFKGIYEGTTYVTFYDSVSGQKATVTVTVSENDYFTYNIADVPEIYVEDFPTNFYNFNGLYIDSYKYKTETYEDPVTGAKKNLETHVSFDVYNSNYNYAIVEVYRFNGELANAILIDKRKDYTTSIYGVLGEGTAATVRGVWTGDLFNYRGEHNSTLTSVELDIPSNGYIKITSDPRESDMLTIVNSVDLLMNLWSLTGDIKGFEPADSKFAKDFTAKLLADTAFDAIKEDGAKVFDKLFTDMGKELVITSDTVGTFADTLSKQLTELDLMEVIESSLLASGISFGEKVFTKMFGFVGTAMETVFITGKIGNVAISFAHFKASVDSGAVRISNQGGGSRSAMGVTVRVTETYDTFASDVALQTYKVELDQSLLDLVKNADKESYELLTKGIAHTYEISLMQNGKNIQHDGDVMVSIPIPEDIRSLPIKGNVKVYRIEENGNLTDMDAVVEDDSIVFTADHFSLYAVVAQQTGAADDNKEPVDDSQKDPDTKDPDKDSDSTQTGSDGSGRFDPFDISSKKDKDTSSSDKKDGSPVVLIIVIVVVLAIACAVAVLITAKKKKGKK